jgi:hypothetical protein
MRAERATHVGPLRGSVSVGRRRKVMKGTMGILDWNGKSGTIDIEHEDRLLRMRHDNWKAIFP